MVVTINKLAEAIKAKRFGLDQKEVYELATFYMNFFGFYGRVYDKTLQPKERDAFYQLEDMGLAKPESELTERPDIKLEKERYVIRWRPWTIVHWVLKEKAIEEASTAKPQEAVQTEQNTEGADPFSYSEFDWGSALDERKKRAKT